MIIPACRTLRKHPKRAGWPHCLLAAWAFALVFQLGPRNVLAEDALDRPITLDIPANTRLEDALIEWGTKAGMTVMINTRTVEHQVTPRIHGTWSARNALTLMLRNSGLTYTNDAGRIRVISPNTMVHSSIIDAPLSMATPESDTRIASTAAGADIDNDAHDGAPSGVQRAYDQNTLAQVVVTAEKREERLQDVPIPMTAVNTEALTQSNQLLLRDFSSSVPGFSISPSPGGGGQQIIAIRGITTGYNTNPNVAMLIDDVPFLGSLATYGNVSPDIDPGSLAQIEVLRGPQGTLYGASGMGGLIKYVTLDPSTAALSGRVQAGVNGVYNGSDPGYNFRASVNVPLGDTLAVRISGFTREDPGYIDNVVTHADGVNEDHANGGLITALWRPTEAYSLKLNALYQHLSSPGAYEADLPVNGYKGPPLGELQQDYVPGLGGYERKVQFYSATFNAKAAGIDITSVTGYSISPYFNTVDFSYSLGPTFQKLYGVSGADVASTENLRKFSQEIRALIPLGDRIDWLVGGFYTHEAETFDQSILAVNAATGAYVNTFELVSAPPGEHGVYREYAGFTDLTYRITDRFDVQLGGRQTESTNASAPSLTTTSSGTTTSPPLEAKLSAFTYLLTPRFKLSSDMMVYARFASGYQPGGPIYSPGTGSPLFDPEEPTKYSPSKTRNYEIGFKTASPDQTLTFDGSFYYIDWTDLQINVVDPVNRFNYTANASEAKSEGVEFSVTARPLSGLAIGAWIDYDDAVLTRNFPTTATLHGLAGDRLPYSSRYSGNLSADETFALTGKLSGFIGFTASYTGDRVGTFISTPNRETYPAYTKVDLRTGMIYGSWRADIYANNVGNSRALLGGGLGTYPPFAFTYITPRVVGLNIQKTF
jgi:iron complex outermembrane receptor protein